MARLGPGAPLGIVQVTVSVAGGVPAQVVVTPGVSGPGRAMACSSAPLSHGHRAVVPLPPVKVPEGNHRARQERRPRASDARSAEHR